MGGSGWNLDIPNNAASDPFTNSPWGSPYAVAFNMTVANCTASGGWVSAAEPEGAEDNNSVSDGTGNTNWQFKRPEIVTAETVYDNVIRVTFQDQDGTPMAIENSSNEIWNAVSAAAGAPGNGSCLLLHI